MQKRIAQFLFITLICTPLTAQAQHAHTKTMCQHLRSAALTAYRWRGTILTCIAAGLAFHTYTQTNSQTVTTELLSNAPICPLPTCTESTFHTHKGSANVNGKEKALTDIFIVFKPHATKKLAYETVTLPCSTTLRSS